MSFNGDLIGTAVALRFNQKTKMRVRFLTSLLQLSLVAVAGAQTQPGCPAVHFQTAVSANLQPSDSSHIVLLRQSDGSYTGYEMTDQSPYRIIRKTANFQNQLTACLPSHSSLPPLPPPAGSGNPPGAPSQAQAFARLSSGKYLVVNPSNGVPDSTVALFDSELNFISQSELPVFASSFAFVDVNGDGNLDLVAASEDENPKFFQSTTTIEVFLGDGGLGFKPAGSYQLSCNECGPVSFAVADLNGNHKLDLVIATHTPFLSVPGYTISVFLGNGDGTFQPERVVYSSITDSIFALSLADLNGDGRADLAFTGTNALGNVLAVALGNGDGTFGQPTQYQIANELAGNPSLAIGDVNGDGFPDIVTSGISIFLGNGTGAFPRRQDYLAPAYGQSVILTDLDGDGRLDIVVANGNPLAMANSISVLFGWDDGTYFGPRVSVGPGGALAGGDFNGDGIPDLVSTTATGIALLAGDGAGGFSSIFHYDYSGSFGGGFGLVVADFNRDGKPDIAALTQNTDVASPGMVYVSLGLGDGTFELPRSFAVPAGATALTTGDFNGDGKADLAVVTTSSEGVANGMPGATQDRVLTFLGNGDGTFSPANSYAAGPDATGIVAGDFNGDGKVDLVITNGGSEVNPPPPGPPSLAVLFGKGDGAFSAGPITQIGIGGVVVADFNRDGKLDLAGFTGTGLTILLGRGDGTFEPLASYQTNGGAAAVVDLNGDNIPDLIVGASYLLGNGDGTFQPAVDIVGTANTSYYYLNSPVAADLNRDGKIDIAGATSLGVVSFLNISTPPPALTVVSAASFSTGPVAPDSLATAFGKNLAFVTSAAAGLPLPTKLGGTTIGIQDASGTTRPAPLIYASLGQVNFLIPAGTTTGTATVTVTTSELFANFVHSAQVQIAQVAPSLFTLNADGLAAAYVTRVRPGQPQTNEPVFTLQNGSLVAKAIDLGPSGDQVYLILYGTGVRSAGTAGVTVNIEGLNAPVSYAGPQSEFEGLDQINVLLPRALAGSGDVSVVLTAAGVDANTVHITIQ